MNIVLHITYLSSCLFLSFFVCESEPYSTTSEVKFMNNYCHKLVLFSKLKHIALPIPEMINSHELFLCTPRLCI